MNNYIKSFQIAIVLISTFLFLQSAHAQRATAEPISSIAPPSIEENIPVKDGERFVTYRDGYLFSVNFWGGIQIWDIANVSSPTKVAFLRTEDMVYHIEFLDNKLFAANKNAGVIVFDISNIHSPYEIARIQTPGDAYWIDINYPNMLVAMGDDGFCVMDISDLKDPRTISLEILDNWIWSVRYHEGKIYVAAKQGGFFIYDAENLSNLIKITQYKTGYHTLQCQIEDSLAYIADGPGGLLILDISSPRLIKEVGRYESEGFSNHVFKSGNYAYLSNRELGLLIVKVIDPENPELEAQYITDSETYASFKEDVYVFLSTDARTEILRHNNQPILDPLTDLIIDENNNFALQLQAYDPDGDEVYYEGQNFPEGSQFDTETGLFTWTPTFEQSGIYPNVNFTVIEKTGSKLSDSETISITVNHVNRVPELPPIANAQIFEDSLLIILVQEGSDPDQEDFGKLTYRVENIPEGVEFEPATREFRWKPSFDQSGTYIVDFVLDDGAGGADREAVTITVTHVDRAPQIESIVDQSVNEAESLTLTLNGEELDKEDLQSISFNILNLPQGASFDPTAKELKWTPSYDQSGNYPNITAVMTAGSLSDTTYFSITVNHVNRPPVLEELVDQTVDENAVLQVKINGLDPDVEDTGKLTFAAENLPAGAVFDPDSLILTWKPTFEQSGIYADIIFTVSDPQGLSDQKSISVSVNHINRPPVLSEIPTLSVNENEALEHQLSASDPDAEDSEKLVFTIENLPEGLNLDTKSGKFAWTPTFDQSGSYEVTFTISDGNLTNSRQTVIKVNHINRPPVLEDIEDKTTDENLLLTFTIKGSDPDKEDEGLLTYNAQNLPTGATFNPNNQSFSWTPTYEQSGLYSNITFQISDSVGAIHEKSVNITVNHVNRSPELSPLSAITTDEQQSITFTLVGSDPDREDTGKLTYAVANLPEGATIDLNTGQFTWTPSYDQSGGYTLNAQVADSAGLNATTTIAITVNNVNRPPIVEPMEQITGRENEPFTVTLKFSDPDKEDLGKLIVSATGLPEGSQIDPTNGIISWTPTYDQSGQYSVDYLITDSFGATNSGNLTILVENVNRPPITPEVSDLETAENAPISTSLPEGSDPDVEDEGKLTYALENLPNGATFNPTTRSLQWTPTYNQAGNYVVSFTVNDAEGLTSQTNFTVNVINVNRPPILPDVNDREANEGESVAYTLPGADDPDEEDATKLQYTLDNLPDGASFNAASRTLSWKPRFDQAGSYSLTYSVKDAAGEIDQKIMTVTVKNVNQQPEFKQVSSKSVKEGEEISFRVEAEDADPEDQGRLSYSADNLPPGANFNASTRTFSWIPRDDQQGEYKITFTVRDGQEGSAQISVNIEVEDVPPPAPPEQ